MADEQPPVVETTVTQTTKATGEAATAPPPSPPAAADDAIRREIARYVIFSDMITCLVVLGLLFLYGAQLSKDVLAIAATIIGSIIGYRARDTGTVIGYEFGSSSGSTAKSVAQDARKP